VVLDAQLHVRSYTEAATAIFPLKPADRGRPLTEVASRLKGTAHLDDAIAVAGGAPAVQRRVTTVDGDHVYSLRVLPYRTQSGGVDGTSLVLTDITEALALERQLASERERLDLAIKAAGIGVWEYCPETGETVLDGVEQRLFDVDAQDAGHIEPLFERIDPEDRESVKAALLRAVTDNQDYEATFRVRLDDDQVRWVKGFGRIVAGSSPRRLVGVSIDVTPEYSLAETRELMLREMNHRVKNLFAVIAGMVTIAARSEKDVRAFAEDIRQRIAALGRAHSLASPAGRPQAIGFGELVDLTLAPYRDQARIQIDGPDVALDRSCLSPIALMLHEWATNAVKYGALSSAGERRLSISWRVEEDGVHMLWDEERGDAVPALGNQAGFGSVLVETSIRQLRGEVVRSVDDDRFRLTVALPRTVFADE
jgi:two-component system CheB/CheR fusion protein